MTGDTNVKRKLAMRDLWEELVEEIPNLSTIATLAQDNMITMAWINAIVVTLEKNQVVREGEIRLEFNTAMDQFLDGLRQHVFALMQMMDRDRSKDPTPQEEKTDKLDIQGPPA